MKNDFRTALLNENKKTPKKGELCPEKAKTFLKIFSMEIRLFCLQFPPTYFRIFLSEQWFEKDLWKQAIEIFQVGPHFSRLYFRINVRRLVFDVELKGGWKKINRYSSRASNRWMSEKRSTAPAGWTISLLHKNSFFRPSSNSSCRVVAFLEHQIFVAVKRTN